MSTGNSLVLEKLIENTLFSYAENISPGREYTCGHKRRNINLIEYKLLIEEKNIKINDQQFNLIE